MTVTDYPTTSGPLGVNSAAAADWRTYPPRPEPLHRGPSRRCRILHAAQGCDAALWRRRRGGSTNRDGLSKRCPGSDRLAGARALAPQTEPRTPRHDAGAEPSGSSSGPTHGGKDSPVSCGRAALPHRLQEVPGGYAALRLELTQNLECWALRGARSSVVSRELVNA